MLPSDGRFGSGPAKVPQRSLDALAAVGPTLLGTSHRRQPVRSLVASLRAGLAELFSLPEGYEVVLGNGGATTFWDVASFCLIEQRSQHCCFGEFSSKFAAAVAGTPHLEPPDVRRADPGTRVLPSATEGVDTYALVHCETSTGVVMPIERPGAEGLVLVDATSAAGGMRVDPRSFDAYYFSAQKAFAADGGLWIALVSPAALERASRLRRTRWAPQSLDLTSAAEQSRKDQTLNTPALATLQLMATQLAWLLDQGGLEWAAARCEASAERLYGWAEASGFATPFVAGREARSPVVGTIDFDPEVDAATVAAVLRAHGVVDTEPYRSLGRNQLRIGLFPAIEPDDVSALCECVDYVVEAMTAQGARLPRP